MLDDSLPSREAWRISLAAILGLHLLLVGYGAFHPEASLRFDRAAYRLRAASALAKAQDPAAAAEVLRQHSAIGDYAWHALLWKVSCGSIPALQLLQLGLWAASLIVLYRLVRELGASEAVARIATLLLAAIPIDFMIPHFLSSEAVFNPLLLLSTWLLVRTLTRGAPVGHLVLAGLLLSLAGVTRPEILPWVPVAAVFVLAASTGRGAAERMSRMLLFSSAAAFLPIGWWLMRAWLTGDGSFGAGDATFEGNVRIRMEAVRLAVGLQPLATSSGGSVYLDLAEVCIGHPVACARTGLFHAAKLLVLPSNLDGLRYLDLYQWTGTRSEMVHTLGWIGALRAVLQEMPWQVGWLLIITALFNLLWIPVLRALPWGFGGRDPKVRMARLLVLSLPLFYVATRIVGEGEARRRSPSDFAIATYAAVGIGLLRSRSSDPGGRAVAGQDVTSVNRQMTGSQLCAMPELPWPSCARPARPPMLRLRP